MTKPVLLTVGGYQLATDRHYDPESHLWVKSVTSGAARFGFRRRSAQLRVLLGARVDDTDLAIADIGDGFLAELSRDWENAHLSATEVLGARSAVLRMAVSLSPTGGVFPLMMQPFRVGLGGWLGTGKQFLPWISIRDTIGATCFLLDNPGPRGVFNGCVPEPTRQKEWAKALGRAIDRPVVRNAPRWALRGAFGELADTFFLASIRAVPRKLQQAGYRFQDTDPEATFRWLVSAFEDPDPEITRNRPARRRRRRNRIR